MCGIVGMAGNLQIKHERAFGDLLIMNQLRGFDSVGICHVGWANKPTVLKSLADPATFIASREYKEAFRGIARVLLGHNRAATAGAVTTNNAHPFTHGPITGVHNGTLVGLHLLEDNKNFKVDSDNLYHHINKKGIDDAWKNTAGAAALVWWNEEEGTITFLRNKERPLYYVFNKEGNVILWASEYHMIYAACHRQGIELAGNPSVVTENVLHTVKVQDGPNRHKPITIMKRDVAPCTYKPEDKWERFNGVYGTYRPKHYDTARPSFLFVGNKIDVFFDNKDDGIIEGSILYEGWNPLDDRVNITYVDIPGARKDINVDNKSVMYTGEITNISVSWIAGVPEWNIRVKNVVLKDRKVLATDAELNCDLRGTCPVKKEVKCSTCLPIIEKLNSNWIRGTESKGICDWCGDYHPTDELVFADKDHTYSICASCFKDFITYMENVNSDEVVTTINTLMS